MNPLKKTIPNSEDFFNYQFYFDFLKKMNILYPSDVDDLIWRKLRVRCFWSDAVLKQIINQRKLNEATKKKNSKL